MKKLLIVALLIISGISYSQSNEYRGYLEELYVARQPSPRAEAIGRGHVADNQNDFGSFYNPALTSLSEGLVVNTSFSHKYFYTDSAFYNYFGASYKLKNVGTFSLSRYHFNYGQEFDATSIFNPDGSGEKYQIYYDIFTLNYSREIYKDFFAGVNINLIDNHNPDISIVPHTRSNVMPAFDIGLLKKFNLTSVTNSLVLQSVNLGLSVNNFTSSKFVYEDSVSSSDAYLPVIFRLGGSYNVNVKGNSIKKNGNVFSLLAHLEYEKILNTAKYETYKVGGEVTLWDIVSLRAGWFLRSANVTRSVFSYNLGEFNQFTYGAGVKIPVDAIFNMKTPISVSIDYVNMKQPQKINYAVAIEYPEYKRFNTLGVSLNWVPGL